jgi:hypothetical protein
MTDPRPKVPPAAPGFSRLPPHHRCPKGQTVARATAFISYLSRDPSADERTAMRWTVACFCGTVFESPATRCPTCHAPVPKVTTGEDGHEPVQTSDSVAELLTYVQSAAKMTATRQ